MRILTAISDRLKGKTPTLKRRSPRWPAVRKTHLARFPQCAACGRTKRLEAHHIIPFHLSPECELHPDNLITLCESKKWGINCHLLIGHTGNYSLINESVTDDAIAILRLFSKTREHT